MSTLLLTITALIYVGVACDYALHNSPGMTLVFAAYAVANVGFIITGRA